MRTMNEIFKLAKESKVEIIAMVNGWSNGYFCSFKTEQDGMKIEGSITSKESFEDAVQQAWGKFEQLAMHGNQKLLAPMLEHQPSSSMTTVMSPPQQPPVDDDIPF